MSKEIFDCLKRERDICVKTIIPSQNIAFRRTPTSMKKVCGRSSELFFLRMWLDPRIIE